MAKRATKITWTEEQEARLIQLIADGASPTRAAGALKRNITAVRVKARLLGRPFPPLREARKKWAPEAGEKN